MKSVRLGMQSGVDSELTEVVKNYYLPAVAKILDIESKSAHLVPMASSAVELAIRSSLLFSNI